MGGVRPAQEQASLRLRPAIGRELHARLAPDDLGDAVAARLGQLPRSDDGDVADGVGEGFDALRRHKANNSAIAGHYPDKDGYRSHSVSGTLGYRWAEGHRIGLTAYNGYLDGDYDNEFTRHPDTYAIYRQQAYGLSSTDRIADWWDSDLRFGFTKDGNDNRSDTSSVFNTLKRHYSWINTFKPRMVAWLTFWMVVS